MNYKTIESELNKFDSEHVNIYLNYLKLLESEKKDNQIKNKWFKYFTELQSINIFRKVAKDGVFIDGETITLQFKGKVMASYDFNAYKNRLLNIYPETKIDLQLVLEGDNFSFKKESGKVIYSHEISNPFKVKNNIIGAYCIIKNNRGEFLETINQEDIKKFKGAAKTQKIWDIWESEMILKSVIKRACKRHFKDIVTNMEILDNEANEPENIVIPSDIQKQIEDCKTNEELTIVYNENINEVEDKNIFIKLLTEKKEELKNDNS